MIKSVSRIWQALALVAGVQTAVLGWIVWDRVSLLQTGREVVLEVTPVDPRSLFRGDYVILSYQISRVSSALLVGPPPVSGAPVYVTIEQKEGNWHTVALSASRPSGPTAGQVVLAGRLRRNDWRRLGGEGRSPDATVGVRFGIESYFVPEGKGRALESLVQDRRISAVIAVGADGAAAIKGLAVDGKRLYEEPLL